jgi:hypothetical protein
MTRPPSNLDLFGPPPPVDPRRDNELVRLPMCAMGEGTDKAWFLSPDGKPSRAKFAPRALVTRGVGKDINVFSMPRWVARERGWL